MNRQLKLPVGIENFQEVRQLGFYYVDKTKMIEHLLSQWGKVNLFTRPRRFGKTLNMSMLRYFFEIGTDPTLFDGLFISQNKELCETYLGKFPVVFLSLKNVDGLTFEEARYRLTELIAKEAERFGFLADSDRLSENEKKMYQALTALSDGRYTMDELLLVSAIQTISQLLYRHYGQKIILLMDEYDVPLDKAFQHGYYREMVSLIRGMFGQALKTNDFLYFAVLTGCLRVSKESIFTGLNNLKVLASTDARFDEYFGFTDEEVKILLEAYHLESHMEETKEWYDGYHFGNADIYCPWDVISHVDRLCGEPTAAPQAYWINTSGNDLVKRFIEKADKTTRDEIEALIAGGLVEKPIRLELTYDEIDNSINNLWSVLFTTGYLTQAGRTDQGDYRLRIPNKEVREVYKLQIQEWFRDTVLQDTEPIRAFLQAFTDGNAKEIEARLTKILGNMISILDTKARDEEKEIFYHGVLLGLLRCNFDWSVKSNVEAGDGFADIIVEPESPDAGIIVELKYSQAFSGLESACERALAQIRDRRYAEYLKGEGRNEVLACGIAFCKKRCRVVVEKL